MRVLLPFISLYRRHWFLMSLGIILAMITLLASIGLLMLSGWFLAGTALAGFAGLYTYNYMLPAAGVRGAAIFRTVSRYFERLVSHEATFRVLAHLRVQAFQKLLPLSPGGIARFRQGDLLNRIVADVETLDHLYLRVISPITSAFVVILVLVLGLSFLDVHLAYTLGGIMLALLLCLPIIFYRAGQHIGKDITTLRGQYRTQLTAYLQGQAELTVFGALPRFHHALSHIEQRWLQRQQQKANLMGISQGIVMLSAGLTSTLLMWMAARHVGGNTQPGALIALFVFCGLAAFEALGPVAMAFQHLGQVMASATRLSQLFNEKPTVNFSTASTPTETVENITFSHVNFTYPEQRQPALKTLSLTVKQGEHIAILGKTGCGKSTLLQLITRAWDPTSGNITLNQQPLSYYDERTLRHLMSVVPQRIHLFSDTLRNNLLLANAKATDDQLCAVLNDVGLEYLLDTEQQLNAWLGEGGRQLSGGEQRRLGIARALLHDAPLFLFDEPTEGLDAETEQRILTMLKEKCAHKTCIIVTHRLQGLDHFNKIYVMENGEIIEQGTHQQLLTNDSRYTQFYERYHHKNVIRND